MNKRMILRVLGILFLTEAALMLPTALVAVIYSESVLKEILYSIALCAAAGGLCLMARPRSKRIFARDGLLIVALGWIVLSVFGAMPFFLSGEIPHFVDAFFETVSGFTTTGASILTDVEVISRSLLFWRSFTHWVGGMGVLVFMMAVLPLVGGGGDILLMRAESPGPEVEKLVPKSTRTAKLLYGMYLALTIAEIVLLLCGGLPLFDSLTLSFGTAGTGGFGIKNDSLTSYSPYVQWVVTIFMSLFGVNFSCYYLLLCKRAKEFFKNEELRVYYGIMLSAIVIVVVSILPSFTSFSEAIRAAAFQVSSVMTTTGYTTADFDKWPETARMVMLMVMCVGASAGSTGGGVKVSRVIILLKSARAEVKKLLHPRSVSIVTFNGKRVADATIRNTMVFFVIYVAVFIFSVLLVSIDTKDFTSNLSGVVATLNNIGPGLGVVGATGNYAGYSVFSKLVFSADMLLGRLEIFPILLAFSPSAWRK